MKFCIVDVSNLVHRAKHAVGTKTVTNPYSPFEESEANIEKEVRAGLVMTVVFNSLIKAADKFRPDHVVACFDSWSWRKDAFPEYKANRNYVKSPEEEADQKLIHDTIDNLREFLEGFTNVTVLHAPGAEADDFVARWIQLHDMENIHHVILSADGDFKQLVRPRVDLFDPMFNNLYTIDGVFYQDDKVKQKFKPTDRVVLRHGEKWKVKLDKNGEPVTFDPEWELFVKCIRGDSSDNIPSAYPRVRTDKMKKAFYGDVEEWNNFINSQWGKDEVKNSVRDLYERNKTLIDLTAQPDVIKEVMDNSISDALDKTPSRFVGAYFAKFCAKYKLVRLASKAERISAILTKRY